MIVTQQEAQTLKPLVVVPFQILSDSGQFIHCVVHRARYRVVTPHGLDFLHPFQLVNGTQFFCQYRTFWVAKRKLHHDSVVIWTPIKVTLILYWVSVVTAHIPQSVVRLNPYSSDHVLSVCGVNARGYARKQAERTRGLCSRELDRLRPPMFLTVLLVVFTQGSVNLITPLQLLRTLEDTRDTNTHAHVLVNDLFSLFVVTRKTETVFVDTVQQLANVQELFLALDVREKYLGQTARFIIGEGLFSTNLLHSPFQVIDYSYPRYPLDRSSGYTFLVAPHVPIWFGLYHHLQWF